MPLRKIARIVNAAYKDADQARKTSQSPEFRKAVTKDRRGALSEFRTVKHALADRERIAKKGSGKAKGGSRRSGGSNKKG
ncbi:MAG: hypothetical protein A3G84_00680 [Chloroflexi bacterium RIFCSPLOWO2_12_FULL_71_12]|nr:MAG: hypothetical protein A3H36_07045 [Chloroflexi bacterium RIFCSPLOWO2_02_FULL_71_16]OGO73343.1 MAG: hypothetical protein A3G84_00680 [Chloroflexi bacterium RIFCSPLOWO2_12_FULL_71_12]